MLNSLLAHPARPFIVIIGGAKIEDKLPVIKNLLERADRILVAGGVANTFLASGGVNIQKSIVDESKLELARQLERRARGRLVLPVDFVWDGDSIADIGAKTIEQFKLVLKSAQTVLWNGTMGRYEDSRYRVGSEEIALSVAGALSTSVIGGGNTIEVVNQMNLSNRISFISTGGGAMLEYLSGKVLPGIKALG